MVARVMKQLLFRSRIAPASASPVPPADPRLPSATFLDRIKAARGRHSACGVSSLIVRQGDQLLGVLEGASAYVDRMVGPLLQDGLLAEMQVLEERAIDARQYSEVALSLVETDTLSPRPSWAEAGLATLDLRAARKALKSLRAFHGLHAEPVRASHLHQAADGILTGR